MGITEIKRKEYYKELANGQSWLGKEVQYMTREEVIIFLGYLLHHAEGVYICGD